MIPGGMKAPDPPLSNPLSPHSPFPALHPPAGCPEGPRHQPPATPGGSGGHPDPTQRLRDRDRERERDREQDRDGDRDHGGRRPLSELPATAPRVTSRRRDAPRGGSHVRPEPGAPPTPLRTRGRRRGAFFNYYLLFSLESGGERAARRAGAGKDGGRARAADGPGGGGAVSPGRQQRQQVGGRGGAVGLPVAAVAAQTGGAVIPSAPFPPPARQVPLPSGHRSPRPAFTL